MSVPVPEYIKAARIQDDEIRYLWDDWGDQVEDLVDEEAVALIDGLSQRAALTFMCASAEWLIHRLAHLCDDPAPIRYVEAAWAMVVDLRYRGLSWLEYEDESWVGPVKKPISECLHCLEEAIQNVSGQEDDPATFAVDLAHLTAYVMSDASPFERWREQAMKRLQQLYPRDPEDDLGEVVPREALDPEYSFDIKQSESLINRYLKGLDWRSNPFLRFPELMSAGDDEFDAFKGTPYEYDIEADRRLRCE